MDHHSFNVKVAEKYGVDEAILIQNFCFWLEKNAVDERNYHDGRYWTYMSVVGFKQWFPYFTGKQIRTRLESLEKQNAVITGNYNKERWDNTKWYSFSDEFLDEWGKVLNIPHLTKRSENPLTKRSRAFAQTVKPIPDTDKTDSVSLSSKETGQERSSCSASQLIKWKSCLEELKRLNGFKIPEVETPELLSEDWGNTVPITKTLNFMLAELDQILAGRFLQSIGYHGSVEFPRFNSPDEVARFLRRQIDKFMKMRDDPTYWPVDKSSLEKVKGPAFLRNGGTGTSWLLWTMEHCLENLRDWVVEDYETFVPNEIMQDFERIVGESGYALSKAVEWLWRKAEEVTDRARFQSNSEHFAKTEQVLQRYIEFVDGFGDGVGIGHLKSEKMWVLFRNEMLKKYDFDIELGEEVIEEEEKRQKQKSRVEKEWENGEGTKTKWIYDGMIRYVGMLPGGRGEERKREAAERFWKKVKDEWEYDCEWIKVNIDGEVVEKGGEIDDEKGIRTVLK